ncbi:MAG: RIP metalloprotease RseP [Bradymonadales bacterium]|nr:MAG: RIP metalloprotease RseP [Bradymonadales bacterium]
MTWLFDLGLFALLFFLLVFFHELGHFLMARWMGVRVEKFSIGMGPQLVSKKWGDTDYRIAILPLGGYVKMSGDDPTKEYSEEEKKVGFLTQPPRKKLVIVLGGPVFNLILPIFIFSFMLSLGIPTREAVIGMIEPESAAESAGLQVGDRVLQIDGEEVRTWDQFHSVVIESPERELLLGIERLNVETQGIERLMKTVRPRLGEGMTRFREPVELGRVGVDSHFLLPVLFLEGESSALYQAGFRKFDQITRINGLEILALDQLRAFFNARRGGELLELEFIRNGATQAQSLRIPEGRGLVIDRLGLLPIEAVVGQVTLGGAADRAGIKEGDRLISVDGLEIRRFEDLQEGIKQKAGEPISLVWSRQGERMTAELQPEKTTIADPLLGKDNPLAVEEIYRIGVGSMASLSSSHFYNQSWNPVVWLSYSANRTWELTSMTGEALWKLATGQLSLRNLGSPIMIYKVAGNTYRLAGGGHHGWIQFLTTLALLSITLGLVNLLPIPILDGGHVVFFSLEALRGRPVSLRTMEIASQVGLLIIFSLFALVLYNDFYRYGFFDRMFQIFQ